MSNTKTPPEDTLEWSKQWVSTVGSLPPEIIALRRMSPIVEESYRAMRTWLFEERTDGLSRPMKELIMIVLDIGAADEPGALSHLQAGMRNGLTPMQVKEALTQCFMVLGITSFYMTGHKVWAECEKLSQIAGNTA